MLGSLDERRWRVAALVRWWRTSPRLTLMRLMPGTGRALTATIAVLVVLEPLLVFVLTIATGQLMGAVPGAVHDGFDSDDGRRLLLALWVLGGAFILDQISGAVREVLAWVGARRLDRQLKARVLDATLTPAGVAHLEDPEVLDKIAITRSETHGFTPGMGMVGIAQVGVDRLRVIPPMVLLATFRWWLPLVLFTVLLWMRIVMRRHLMLSVSAALDQTSVLRRSHYFVDLAMTPGAAKETRIFGLGDWLADRFRSHYLEAMKAVWRTRARGQRRLFLPILAVTAADILGFVLVVRAGARGDIDLARLTILIGAMRGAGAMLSLSNHDVMLEQGVALLPTFAEIDELMAERSAELSGSLPADGLPVSSVRFEGVCFHYPRSDHEIYDGLDLELRVGQSLAIVGLNGAGKTTLVKLLARLYDPTAGRITVDGVDLIDIDPTQWQRRVAAIFQDFTRYELSAADNVGFGGLALAHDRAALEGAAEQAGAGPLVAGLTDGWDTTLSRRFTGGTDLSGGEWQRIALARALLAVRAGAGILVLDEPTANLDVRAEAELYDRFLELTRGVTTVVISHRFSTVRRADRIVVLDAGRVVEDGSHDELVAAGGEYARMFALQASRFTEAVTLG